MPFNEIHHTDGLHHLGVGVIRTWLDRDPAGVHRDRSDGYTSRAPFIDEIDAEHLDRALGSRVGGKAGRRNAGQARWQVHNAPAIASSDKLGNFVAVCGEDGVCAL